MSFCDCKEDGWCHRYQRQMTGRFREICAGINIDLGTAAVFREQWQREAPLNHTTPYPPMQLLLKTDQAPGDALVMTAAIYSLHKAHPGKYLTAVESPYPDIFANNPDVVFASSVPDALPLHMHYPAIHESNNRGIHFMQGWCEHLGRALGIEIPLATNRPHLYFDSLVGKRRCWSCNGYGNHLGHGPDRGNPKCRTCKGTGTLEEEPPPVEDYWLICSGGKNDFTNKLWGRLNYNIVTASLAKRIKFIQVGASCDEHRPLKGCNVVNMVGKTSLRELFNLARRSRGVVCGVTLLMHVAAALEKPAVIIAGGREPVQWNSYPKQQYLHTIGALPCSPPNGEPGEACWRSRVLPLGDGSLLDKDTCQRPIGKIPECMALIHPEEVVSHILRYNEMYEQESTYSD